MLNLLRHIRGLLATRLACEPAPLHPDQMSLRDWSDLPPHHPICEKAPC